MKDSLPSSTSVHTAELVSTLVWLNSRNRLSLVAGQFGGLGLRVAIGAEQCKLAVPRERDLRAGIAAFLDMLLDQPIEMIERLGGEAETGGIAGRQRIFAWHGRFSSHLGQATDATLGGACGQPADRFDPSQP